MTTELPTWERVREHAKATAEKGWAARLTDEGKALMASLPEGWAEVLEDYQTGQQLLTDAGVPERDRNWAYSDRLDSRIAQHVVPALSRLARIAEAHRKDVDQHGGTNGLCNECGWVWPCPTSRWATGYGDPAISPWDPADSTEEATDAAH